MSCLELIVITYRQCNDVGKDHDDSKYGADFPGQLDRSALLALRPEEVKEESCAEDCGNIDASEDVEGRDANNVVVVYVNIRIACLKPVLLLVVVWHAIAC